MIGGFSQKLRRDQTPIFLTHQQIQLIKVNQMKFFCLFCCMINFILIILVSFVGKYYLVDAGYLNTRGDLGPYKNSKYHLQDYRW